MTEKQKKVKITPQNERVLVKAIQVSNITRSGLVIATEGISAGVGSEGKIETSFAEIVAVSEDLKNKHKVGEVVYHSPRAGIKVSLYQDKFKILTDMEILAKLEIDKTKMDDVIRDNIV